MHRFSLAQNKQSDWLPAANNEALRLIANNKHALTVLPGQGSGSIPLDSKENVAMGSPISGFCVDAVLQAFDDIALPTIKPEIRM